MSPLLTTIIPLSSATNPCTRLLGAEVLHLLLYPLTRVDVEALVDYIYATLGMDLDYILPFTMPCL